MPHKGQQWFDRCREALAEIDGSQAGTPEAAEQFRIRWLGSKGIVRELMSAMKEVPAEEKKAYGQLVNDLKARAEAKHRSFLPGPPHGAAGGEIPDLSLPADPMPLGSLHPLTIVRDRIVGIFARMGYSVSEGPEIEDDWHNFTALNFPPAHPARDLQDTFFIRKDPDVLLRTHTSPVQIRVMETTPPPIRTISPGRTFRNETISARAHCMFHQVEGLYVDEGVSFADLKQTLYHFVQEMFGRDMQMRLRPSFFPFTEPSGEVDISCLICRGEGCPVCKHSGWVEIMGCGMVHPAVLENCKIDSSRYTGFAFGMGIERIAMLKYRMNDIRVFFENDVRFLGQFTSEL